MVQEDLAEGLGLLYKGLYTFDEGFKALPKVPQTLIQLLYLKNESS